MTSTPDFDTSRASSGGQWPTRERAWYPAPRLAIVCLVLFALVTADVLADGLVRQFDGVVASWIKTVNLRDDPVGGMIGYLLSQAGGRGANVVWIVILCIVIAVRKRNFAPIARLVLAVALLSVAIYTAKFLVARTAPMYPDGDLLYIAGANSYPSGHQANAILLSSVGAWIAVDFIATQWVRRVLCIYAIAGPLVAAPVVLFMNYHWLSDIVAGACVGAGLLWIVRWTFDTSAGRRLETRLGRPPLDERVA